MPAILKNPPKSKRHVRRAKLRRLRQADDLLRAERAKWAAAGYRGQAPEMRGTFAGDISVDTSDGTKIIFPLVTTPDDPLVGESGLVIDARRRIRRDRGHLGQAGPPPWPQKRRRRLCCKPEAPGSFGSRLSARRILKSYAAKNPAIFSATATCAPKAEDLCAFGPLKFH
jgi:hypothetical protein